MRIRSSIRGVGGILLGLAVALGLMAAPPAAAPAQANAPQPEFTANVMAPLIVDNWGAFTNDLNAVAAYGVDAVSVDVWWGLVEASSDNQFSWGYYDQLFSTITNAGLDIVPIFSFHQCGGNVGDTCDIPLPGWLPGKYTGATLNGVTLDGNGLRHRSEQGNFSPETVQGWATPLVTNEYADFTAAFVARYGTQYANRMQEINVSLGPAGELRYPSYNGHDSGTGYPTRGALQAYSPLAIKSLQDAMIAKYGTLGGVNAAWSTSLTSASQIQPPSNAGFFFSSGDYRFTQYGRDFIDWYNGSLVAHGELVLDTVISELGGAFPEAKIGYKIPGIHWAMGGPVPRAAEVAAGLIQTSVDIFSSSTGRGYENIVSLATRFGDTGRDIVLHFTCLELGNEDFAPQYSQAKTLVGWVADEAARQGVDIKGENALAGGATTNFGWDNVNDAFTNHSYSGMTVLRVGQVASGTGAFRYAQLIDQYSPSEWPSLYVRGTHNAWGLSTPMTKSGDVWTATNVAFGAASGQGFKFDVLGDWSQNFGGSSASGTAVAGGGNIPVQSNTTYTITFNEATLQYAATPTGPGQPPGSSGAVTVKFAEWQSATSYSLHTWNGLNGTFPMQYEGFINGRHWWTITVQNAPSSFGFTFTNSNGNWDTADRAFTGQASTVYVLPGNSTVFTTRP